MNKCLYKECASDCSSYKANYKKAKTYGEIGCMWIHPCYLEDNEDGDICKSPYHGLHEDVVKKIKENYAKNRWEDTSK